MNTQATSAILRGGVVLLVAATLALAAGCASTEEGAGGEGSEPGEPVATATEAPSTPPPSEPANPAPSEPANPVQSDASSFANAGWVLFAALALLFVVTLIVMIARRGREPAPPAR